MVELLFNKTLSEVPSNPQLTLGVTSRKMFLISQIFFARSIKLLSCWGTLLLFEYGWSYRKKSNAGKFVISYRFILKNFRLTQCMFMDLFLFIFRFISTLMIKGQFPIYVPLPQFHYHNRTFLG